MIQNIPWARNNTHRKQDCDNQDDNKNAFDF